MRMSRRPDTALLQQSGLPAVAFSRDVTAGKPNSHKSPGHTFRNKLMKSGYFHKHSA